MRNALLFVGLLLSTPLLAAQDADFLPPASEKSEAKPKNAIVIDDETPLTPTEAAPKKDEAKPEHKAEHKPAAVTHAAEKPKTAETLAPAPKKSDAPAADDEVRAEIVQLPPLPAPPVTKKSETKSPVTAETKDAAKPAAGSSKEKTSFLMKTNTKFAVPAADPSEPGYKIVLSGTLQQSLELKQSDSPVLIKGNLVVPVGTTLKIDSGTVVALKGDTAAPEPQPGTPDARTGAVVWIWGILDVDGVTGNPVELSSEAKDTACLLLYGNESSIVDGARLKNISVTQTAGTALWQNCELIGSRSYALASGAGLFTHCNFKYFGGIFASYNVGPWSLLIRRSLFENCREGVILGSDPGPTRLVVEKNHFINTRGAHVRVLPTPVTRAAAGKADMDILIGENWYGTPVAEDVDIRIVDRRADPSLRARLNIRPPSIKPYADTGAGVPAVVLEATAKEQRAMIDKLLEAQAAAKTRTIQAKSERTEPKSTETAAMSRPVKKTP